MTVHTVQPTPTPTQFALAFDNTLTPTHPKLLPPTLSLTVRLPFRYSALYAALKFATQQNLFGWTNFLIFSRFV